MDTAEKMRTAWAKVFGDDIPPDADFFALGGDSLMAMVLMVHVEEVFGVLLDPVEVFETPALTDFSDKVSALACVTFEKGLLGAADRTQG